ncbi:hypothetical protein J1605_022366 [Eschrichtius robustus]|uniref:Uncharacterized protein n=1 Tax=Eschrichtius robustus TaxID=9764 RepID=A0AB34HDI7_ESCRO|nr:hypothetical protein J1605_022366 [Eschrichtius robustus]
MPASPAWVLGTPHPSQVSLTDTGHGREMFWGPSSVHISGECFHLPNPSPMICPQRGTKGLLTAQISPVSCTAPGKGASGLTGTVKMPSRRASVCVGMSEDQELDVRLQVPKRAGRPGTGVVPDSDPRVRIRPLCPSALLLSAAGGTEHLYPFCCQIEKGQGMEEDDPDPKSVLPSLWHWGGPVCLCNRACTVVWHHKPSLATGPDQVLRSPGNVVTTLSSTSGFQHLAPFMVSGISLGSSCLYYKPISKRAFPKC